jgi:serine/threonine protein kinase
MTPQLRRGAALDRWRLQRPVRPRGGNGVVWRATGPDGQVVALKVLANGARYNRFRDEVAFQRKHSTDPGVLPLLDQHLPDRPTRQNPAWLATPWAKVFPEALRARPLTDVVEAVLAVAETLARFAAEGAAHRDIKPDNLFRFASRWVIGDFGLVTYPDKANLTKPGGKIGPMHYIAPEMLNTPDEADGAAADVYSLAKTLWVMATGQRFPLPGEYRLQEPVFRLGSYVEGPKTPILDQLIEQCTHIRPDHRPTAAEMAGELKAWLTEPESVPMNDVDALVTQLRSHTEPMRRSEAEWVRGVEELEQACYALAQQVLAPVDETLRKAGLSSGIFDGYRLPDPGLSDARAIREFGREILANSPGDGSDSLIFAVGITWLDGRRWRVSGAVGTQSPGGTEEVIWSHAENVGANSAAFKHATHHIETEMRRCLPEVLRLMLRQFES